MNKRSTLADVARAAGVSKTTASMTLNGKGLNKIPEVTRERVLSAAVSMQFRPHGVARALVRRRADVLGIVCTLNPFVELSHHAFEQALLSAIFHQALKRGYNPMIYGLPGEDAGLPEFARYADGRSDAFLMLYQTPDSPLLKYLHEEGIPVIALCYRDDSGQVRWVDSDHESGIRAGVRHLAQLGHRRIAYLIDPRVEGAGHTRVRAFCAALEEDGLPVRADWILPYAPDTTSLEERLDRLFREAEPPTALMTWNDFIAEEVYTAARRLGLRIPEDLSVVGFDDTPTARIMMPALTTIGQDVVHMGQSAVDLALDVLASGTPTCENQFILCPVRLVVRQSTAVPREEGQGFAGGDICVRLRADDLLRQGGEKTRLSGK